MDKLPQVLQKVAAGKCKGKLDVVQWKWMEVSMDARSFTGCAESIDDYRLPNTSPEMPSAPVSESVTAAISGVGAISSDDDELPIMGIADNCTPCHTAAAALVEV